MPLIIAGQILLLSICVWVVFNPEKVLPKWGSTTQAWTLFAVWNLTAVIYAWLTWPSHLEAATSALDVPNASLPLWYGQFISAGTLLAQVLFFVFCVWVVFDSERSLRKLGFTDHDFARASGRPLKILRSIALFSAWNLSTTLYGWLLRILLGYDWA